MATSCKIRCSNEAPVAQIVLQLNSFVCEKASFCSVFPCSSYSVCENENITSTWEILTLHEVEKERVIQRRDNQ